MSAILIPGLVAVLILLALGVPIYLVLMGVASFLLLLEGRSVAGLGQHVLDHLNSPILIAVPFFILAAVLMRGGGLAKVLFDAATAWIGWLPGGLAISGVAATAIFAAITGSSAATMMAMGTLLVPLMVERGYKPSFAMGLTAASGTLGILIPPSLPMLLFGLIAEESIPRLFLGGVIPGLMQAGLFSLYIVFVARRVGGAPEPLVGARAFVRTNIVATPAFMIPVVVLGGIYGGFVTLTEAAVLGALISLIAVLFIYRSARLRDIPAMLTEAIDRTSVIILIVLPVVSLVVREMGIDMTHFAVVMVINIELALLSPPIGLNLFVMSNVTGRPVSEVLRGTAPFFLIMLCLLMLVTFVPALSTWLPNLILGG